MDTFARFKQQLLVAAITLAFAFGGYIYRNDQKAFAAVVEELKAENDKQDEVLNALRINIERLTVLADIQTRTNERLENLRR